MMFGWLLVLIVVVAVVWALAGGRWRGGRAPGTGDRAEEVLREQYARGEIDDETYRRRMDELGRR